MAHAAEAECPQYMTALKRANKVRLARAEVKRELAAGERSLANAMEHWAVATMPVFELLKALPRVGKSKARRIIGQAVVGEHKPVGGLTARQKSLVLEAAGRPIAF